MIKKIIFISGASRGIGKAILESFNNEYFIIGTGTSESSVQSILENASIPVRFLPLNIKSHAVLNASDLS